MSKIVRIISYAVTICALLTSVAIITFFSLQKKQNEEAQILLEQLIQDAGRLEVQNEQLKNELEASNENVERCLVLTEELPIYATTNITKNLVAREANETLGTLHRGDSVIRNREVENGYAQVFSEDAFIGYVWNDALGSEDEWDEEKLNQKVIVIDPGHQGEADHGKERTGPKSKEEKDRVSNGTAGVTTKVRESVLTLDVAVQLEKELEARGYTVILVRRSEDVAISNRERAEVANDIKADAFVRIHADGGDAKSTGCHTICSEKDNPNSDTVPYEDSKKLAKCIMDSYMEATGISGLLKKPSERSDLSGINWSKVPVTILELGFMTNEAEEKKLLDPEFQVKIVNGIAAGVDAYFGM